MYKVALAYAAASLIAFMQLKHHNSFVCAAFGS